MPRFFDLTFKELLAAKHPTAWIQVKPVRWEQTTFAATRADLAPPSLALQFECDEISEEELFRIFFSDGRQFDGTALRQHMVRMSGSVFLRGFNDHMDVHLVSPAG